MNVKAVIRIACANQTHLRKPKVLAQIIVCCLCIEKLKGFKPESKKISIISKGIFLLKLHNLKLRKIYLISSYFMLRVSKTIYNMFQFSREKFFV